MDLISGLGYFWWFTYYYGIILCSAGIFALITAPMVSIWAAVHECDFSEWPISPHIFLGAAQVYLYLCYAVVFLIDALATRHLLKVEENIHWSRNFLHFLLTGPVLLMYSIVEFLSIYEVGLKGKEVCTHDASEKDNLAKRVVKFVTQSMGSVIDKFTRRGHDTKREVGLSHTTLNSDSSAPLAENMTPV